MDRSGARSGWPGGGIESNGAIRAYNLQKKPRITWQQIATIGDLALRGLRHHLRDRRRRRHGVTGWIDPMI